MAVNVDEILQLPPAERRALAEAIWRSLDEAPITEAEKRLIDERLAAIEANPGAEVTWEQARERLLGR